ncbi:MAG TPA: hypothetical protein VF980_06290 [Thermoanaerobaculia bacterium]
MRRRIDDEQRERGEGDEKQEAVPHAHWNRSGDCNVSLFTEGSPAVAPAIIVVVVEAAEPLAITPVAFVTAAAEFTGAIIVAGPTAAVAAVFRVISTDESFVVTGSPLSFPPFDAGSAALVTVA